MSARTWRLPWRSLDLARFATVSRRIGALIPQCSVKIEEEERGTHTAFFTLPGDPEADDDADGPLTCEVSMYDLDRGVVILSLEYDAGDNDALGEVADQIAEDLAEAFEGQPADIDD